MVSALYFRYLGGNGSSSTNEMIYLSGALEGKTWVTNLFKSRIGKQLVEVCLTDPGNELLESRLQRRKTPKKIDFKICEIDSTRYVKLVSFLLYCMFSFVQNKELCKGLLTFKNSSMNKG